MTLIQYPSASRIAATCWRAAFVFIASSCMLTAAQAAVCSVSATGVSFGTYDPLSASDNTSTGTITVQCSGILEGVSYTVNLSKGNGTTYATRYLKAGSSQLNYNLYNATARLPAQIWGDTTSSTVNKSGTMTFVIILTPTTQTEPFTVFGKIPKGQDIAPGDYTDSITVTVTY